MSSAKSTVHGLALEISLTFSWLGPAVLLGQRSDCIMMSGQMPCWCYVCLGIKDGQPDLNYNSIITLPIQDALIIWITSRCCLNNFQYSNWQNSICVAFYSSEWAGLPLKHPRCCSLVVVAPWGRPSCIRPCWPLRVVLYAHRHGGVQAVGVSADQAGWLWPKRPAPSSKGQRGANDEGYLPSRTRSLMGWSGLTTPTSEATSSQSPFACHSSGLVGGEHPIYKPLTHFKAGLLVVLVGL